jgi:hypothetical protein
MEWHKSEGETVTPIAEPRSRRLTPFAPHQALEDKPNAVERFLPAAEMMMGTEQDLSYSSS